MTTSEAAVRGTEFHLESPANRWRVTVPVPGREQHAENCSQDTHRGKPFTATRLWVSCYGISVPERLTYWLSGPNMRQDGELGKLTLTCTVTRADLEARYPGALAALKAGLLRLQRQVRAESDRAVVQITRAINGREG